MDVVELAGEDPPLVDPLVFEPEVCAQIPWANRNELAPRMAQRTVDWMVKFSSRSGCPHSRRLL